MRTVVRLMLFACVTGMGACGSSALGVASDGDVPPPTATTDSCRTLVLTFVGCDRERLAECGREYDAVSAANRHLVDAAVACLRMSFPAVAAAAWPAAGATCTPAVVPPLLAPWDQWFHGTCQGANGDAATSIIADPAFPTCGAAGEPVCFFGPPWEATL